MKKRVFSILKYLLFLGLGIFLVWWQFSKMTLSEKQQFGESLHQANYWLLIPVIIFAIFSHISRAVRWKILIEPLGYHPSTTTAFYSIMCGYLVNTFIPRGGEIVKCSLVHRYEKIPMNKLLGTILIERVFDLVCYFVLIAFTILVQIKYVSHFVHEKLENLVSAKKGTPLWIKIAGIILLLMIIIMIIKWIFKKYAQHRHIISIKGFHLGLSEGFRTIKKLKNRGWFIAHTFFIWLMYLMEIYIGFLGFPVTSHLTIIHACSVLSLGTLGMIVSPGGIGAFPLAVQEVLKIYDIDDVSFGWLIWGVSTGIILVGGIFCFGMLLYKNKKLHLTKSLQADIIEDLKITNSTTNTEQPSPNE